MNWAPEDRMNAFAARLIAEQPNPPRTVSVRDLLDVNIAYLGILLLPALLVAGGLIARKQVVGFALIGIFGVTLVLAMALQQNASARSALQLGLAASGLVTRVVSVGRGSKFVSVRVDAATGAIETQLVRSRAADVLVEGDTVQVLVDPGTGQVLLVLGLLKPSPLYAPPRS